MEKEEEEGKEGDGGRRSECLFEVKISSARIEGQREESFRRQIGPQTRSQQAQSFSKSHSDFERSFEKRNKSKLEKERRRWIEMDSTCLPSRCSDG